MARQAGMCGIASTLARITSTSSPARPWLFRRLVTWPPKTVGASGWPPAVASSKVARICASASGAPLAMGGVDELDRELAEDARPQQAVGLAERAARLLVQCDQAFVDDVGIRHR